VKRVESPRPRAICPIPAAPRVRKHLMRMVPTVARSRNLDDPEQGGKIRNLLPQGGVIVGIREEDR